MGQDFASESGFWCGWMSERVAGWGRGQEASFMVLLMVYIILFGSKY